MVVTVNDNGDVEIKRQFEPLAASVIHLHQFNVGGVESATAAKEISALSQSRWPLMNGSDASQMVTKSPSKERTLGKTKKQTCAPNASTRKSKIHVSHKKGELS